jgi:F-type H+-transporting ATPase subunit epsilon
MPDFACEILTPYRRFFTGRAEAITFTTFDGQVEVLAGHDSFVAPVRIGQLKLAIGGSVKRAAVTEGFARVKDGRVDLYVDAAEWSEEIDRKRAEQALGRATERLAAETLAWRIASSRMAAARARNRIAVASGEPASPPPADF